MADFNDNVEGVLYSGDGESVMDVFVAEPGLSQTLVYDTTPLASPTSENGMIVQVDTDAKVYAAVIADGDAVPSDISGIAFKRIRAGLDFVGLRSGRRLLLQLVDPADAGKTVILSWM